MYSFYFQLLHICYNMQEAFGENEFAAFVSFQPGTDKTGAEFVHTKHFNTISVPLSRSFLFCHFYARPTTELL